MRVRRSADLPPRLTTDRELRERPTSRPRDRGAAARAVPSLTFARADSAVTTVYPPRDCRAVLSTATAAPSDS